MPRVPTIVPVTDLRQGAAEVLKKVRHSRDPVVITQRGRAAAVLLSVQEYERSEYERGLLRALARGEKELRSGEGIDLDDVMVEADRLLNEDQ